jgi:peptide/nickel transport system substrate-binding protein
MNFRPGSAVKRPTIGVGITLLLFAGLACGAPAVPSSPPTSAPAAPAATTAPAAPAATTAPAAAKPTTAPAAAAPAGANQNLIIAIDQSDVKTLDPAREFEFAAAFIDLNVYDTLITQKGPDDLGTFVPVLAKEWKISPDGKEYTFTLRDDVKFASGNPLTADDVKFSLMRLKNIKGNPAWMMDPLKEVQVVDKSTVKTILSDPFGDWLAVLSGPNSGILDSKLVMEHGGSAADGADTADKAEDWLNQNSAGSGPFAIKGWTKNDTISLERNSTYFMGAPKLAKVDVKDVPSPSTQKLQVENGDVDVALSLTPDLVDTLKGNPNVKVVLGQSLDNLYMGMTMDPTINPNLAKKEVRQAIRAAIDYDGVLALTNNQALRGPAIYSIGLLGLATQADADKINPKYDPDKAKQLLAQAGLSGGFSFPLEYGTGPSPVGVTYESIAQKVQADLKKVGIDMQLVPEEFGVMLTKYRQKDRTAVISYNQPDYLGPSDWASQMILNTWAPRLHYDSKPAQDLANQAGAETDPQKRGALYQQMLTLLVDEGPYIELVQGKAPVVTRSNVQGWIYFPIGDARLYGVSKS